VLISKCLTTNQHPVSQFADWSISSTRWHAWKICGW